MKFALLVLLLHSAFVLAQEGLLPGRFHHSITLLQGQLMLVGGTATNGTNVPLTDIVTIRTKSNSNQVEGVSPLPFSITSHTAIEHDVNSILLLFGLLSFSPLRFLPSIIRLRLNITDKGAQTTSLSVVEPRPSLPSPVPRYAHSAAVTPDGSRLFVSGGLVSDTSALGTRQVVTSELWSLRLTDFSWTRNSDLPFPTAGHASVLVGKWLVSCFGMVSVNANLTSDCTLFNIQTLLYEQPQYLAPPLERPIPRTSPSMVTFGNTVVVFGGGDYTPVGPKTYFDDLWLLDVSNAPLLLWTRPKVGVMASVNAPTARSGHAAVALSSDLMAITGGDQGGLDIAINDDTHVFSLSMLSWIDANRVEIPNNRPNNTANNDPTGGTIEDIAINGTARRVAGILLGTIACCGLVALLVCLIRKRRRDGNPDWANFAKEFLHPHRLRAMYSRNAVAYWTCLPMRHRFHSQSADGTGGTWRNRLFNKGRDQRNQTKGNWDPNSSVRLHAELDHPSALETPHGRFVVTFTDSDKVFWGEPISPTNRRDSSTSSLSRISDSSLTISEVSSEIAPSGTEFDSYIGLIRTSTVTERSSPVFSRPISESPRSKLSFRFSHKNEKAVRVPPVCVCIPQGSQPLDPRIAVIARSSRDSSKDNVVQSNSTRLSRPERSYSRESFRSRIAERFSQIQKSPTQSFSSRHSGYRDTDRRMHREDMADIPMKLMNEKISEASP